MRKQTKAAYLIIPQPLRKEDGHNCLFKAVLSSRQFSETQFSFLSLSSFWTFHLQKENSDKAPLPTTRLPHAVCRPHLTAGPSTSGPFARVFPSAWAARPLLISLVTFLSHFPLGEAFLHVFQWGYMCSHCSMLAFLEALNLALE